VPLGAVLVWFFFRARNREEALLASYHDEVVQGAAVAVPLPPRRHLRRRRCRICYSLP
jgi:hypothetical protein